MGHFQSNFRRDVFGHYSQFIWNYGGKLEAHDLTTIQRKRVCHVEYMKNIVIKKLVGIQTICKETEFG